MLSRVALLTYWMARYLERAENTARIVDVNVQLALDVAPGAGTDEKRLWEPVVLSCGSDELFHQHHDTTTGRDVVEFVLFDPRNPSSVHSCIAQARENARCIREQISSEMWEQLNRFHLAFRDEGYDAYSQAGSYDYLQRIKTAVQLFFGITESMFPRTENWHWLELGRLLERADAVSRIVDVKYFSLLPSADYVGSALDVVQWAAVLRSCSAFEAFRRTGQSALTLEAVVRFLLLHPTFPRSLRYSLTAARDHLAAIAPPERAGEAGLDRLDTLLNRLAATTAKRILASGLHEFLDSIQIEIGEVHSALLAAFIHYPVESARLIPAGAKA